MSPRFSIIVPSLGRLDFLTRLIESISSQDLTAPIELILCITDYRTELQELLPLLPSLHSLVVVESRAPGISLARNLGIKAARGDIVLFLDEDCFLPTTAYLSQLSIFCKAHPEDCGGGLYLTIPKGAGFSSAFYNYVCNSWVGSHVLNNDQTSVLLGGCCFYPRTLLIQNQIIFPEHRLRAGEEEDFNRDILKSGSRLRLAPEWSVYHNPNYSLKDIFKRAWTHGLLLENRTVIPQRTRFARFASTAQKRPDEFFKFLPLTVAYSLWGRAAYVSKFFVK